MRRYNHLVATALGIAATTTLLVGYTGGSCNPPTPVCALHCPFGFKTDTVGQEYCECRPAEVCAQVLPEPARDPGTGECVSFPTPCDVPVGWASCSDGCLVDGDRHPVGDTFPSPDECNTCTCMDNGGIACTERACLTCRYDGAQYQPGDSFDSIDGCNRCTCRPNGSVICTMRACPPPEGLCWGAWFDQAGLCRSPNDGLYPPHCCSDQAFCERTGGRWDPWSCGHYMCGEPPLCDAIIPGCDCGPHRVFYAGDGGCGPSDMCGVEIPCADDNDCPQGQTCVGSSLCPEDVVCIWAGELGACQPLQP